jgi:hypothetical protein
MTVQELIDRLQKVEDKDRVVMMMDGLSDFCGEIFRFELDRISNCQVRFSDDNSFYYDLPEGDDCKREVCGLSDEFVEAILIEIK